ncbi:hypothetical protein BDR07DRAFT_1443611, partial [Suillus spraguei]
MLYNRSSLHSFSLCRHIHSHRHHYVIANAWITGASQPSDESEHHLCSLHLALLRVDPAR